MCNFNAEELQTYFSSPRLERKLRKKNTTVIVSQTSNENVSFRVLSIVSNGETFRVFVREIFLPRKYVGEMEILISNELSRSVFRTLNVQFNTVILRINSM